MEIKPGKYVEIAYKLWAIQAGEPEEEIEETQPGRPLEFIMGTGMMLDSFEKNLTGLKKGDKFDFTLKADEAYGNPDAEAVVELPKSVFEVDGKFDSEMVVEGAILPMRDANGNTLNGEVKEITDSVVVMDFNHPMAGADLHFIGEVLEARDPSEDDVKKFTSGGCGGGCGCGDDCGDDCGDSGCGCGCH